MRIEIIIIDRIGVIKISCFGRSLAKPALTLSSVWKYVCIYIYIHICTYSCIIIIIVITISSSSRSSSRSIVKMLHPPTTLAPPSS